MIEGLLQTFFTTTSTVSFCFSSGFVCVLRWLMSPYCSTEAQTCRLFSRSHKQVARGTYKFFVTCLLVSQQMLKSVSVSQTSWQVVQTRKVHDTHFSLTFPFFSATVSTFIALEGDGFMEMRIKHLEKYGDLDKALILMKACANCTLLPNYTGFRQTFVSHLCKMLPNDEAISEVDATYFYLEQVRLHH